MRSSITPKKSLGQHFLVNPRILDKIVSAAEITEKDVVLEIGPGTGSLTERLAEKAGRVIAVEKDRRLIQSLKENFTNTNIGIVEADILKLDSQHSHVIRKLASRPYKVVGNIPYYITSNLLRTIFEKWPRPEIIVLTIQKEVAQRIMAKPPKMNLLAVSIQFFSEPKIIGYVSKENFRPRPKVDSAILKLTTNDKQPTIDKESFFKIVRAGFSQKRKLLVSNLSKKLKIDKNKVLETFSKLKIKPKVRAEELTTQNWTRIAKNL